MVEAVTFTAGFWRLQCVVWSQATSPIEAGLHAFFCWSEV